MDHLIAKIRKRGRTEYRKLVSEEKIYSVSIDECIDYSSSTLIDEDQWYRIQHFSKEKYCIELLRDTWNSTRYEQADITDLGRIEYICSYQDQNDYCFQKIYKCNLVKNRFLLHFGEDVKVAEDRNAIIINEQPDAIYKRDLDCLYFKKLNAITNIFKGIEVLYREATREEVDGFLSESFIDSDYSYTADDVGVANRHRIAMAVDTLKGMTASQRNEVFKYIDEYYPDLQYNGRQFKITKDEDLKKLLYGIEQRFYTTPVTKERRLANSVTKI